MKSINDDTNDSEEILTQNMKGVLLVGSFDDIVKNPKDIKGLQIKNLILPGNVDNLKQQLELLFLNKPLSYKVISQIKRNVYQFYKDHNRPIVTVIVPEQEITFGVLQLIVIESKIEKISVLNNKWFSTKRVLEHINLKEGDYINMDTLLTDVAWLNRYTFQNTSIVINPGKQSASSNVDLTVQDRFPLRLYAGGDNTGTRYTGNNRWFTGFNLGNVFNADHVLSYQYTTSSDFHSFWGHTINYTANLSWKDILIFYGGYSKVNPKLVGLNSEGKSYQASTKYEIPLFSLYSHMQQSLIFGFDFKGTNNNLSAAEEPSAIVKTNYIANLSQFLLSYQLSFDEYKKNRVYFLIELYLSPFRWLSHQTKEAYGNLRPFAKPKYEYFRLTLEEQYKFYKEWSLNFILRAQYSCQFLLPSEQFNLGGESTVRGYENRIISVEKAFCTNLELRTPPIKIINCFSHRVQDSLRFIAFLDWGAGRDCRKSSSFVSESLLGLGGGVRYNIKNNLTVLFDYAWPLVEVYNHKDPHLNFQLILSY